MCFECSENNWRVKHTCDYILKQAALVILPVLQHAAVVLLLAGDVHRSDRSHHGGIVLQLSTC